MAVQKLNFGVLHANWGPLLFIVQGGETRGALNFLKLEKIQRDESGGFEKIY
jgi:hypothetical protein